MSPDAPAIDILLVGSSQKVYVWDVRLIGRYALKCGVKTIECLCGQLQEMKAFLGVTLLMGIVKLPRLNLYWSQAR